MVEIFTTNIQTEKEANIVSGLLHLCFPFLKANVDLYDDDHILRVESSSKKINACELIRYVSSLGVDIRPIAA